MGVSLLRRSGARRGQQEARELREPGRRGLLRLWAPCPVPAVPLGPAELRGSDAGSFNAEQR